MGLDVYLYKCDDWRKAQEDEAEYERRTDEFCKSFPERYDDWTEEQKKASDEYDAKVAEELNIGKWSQSNLEEEVKAQSTIHPNHLFKLGYFRSSYNEGGINSVCRKRGLPTLHDIFPQGDKEYRFAPDWDRALELAQDALAKMQAYADSDSGKYNVMAISHNPFMPASEMPHDEAEAMSTFLVKASSDTAFDEFSSGSGRYYLNGIKVYGMLSGYQKCWNGRVEPVTYVIAEGFSLDWYIQALEIVVETIEYVLAQPDKEKYYLHWSG